VIVYRINWQKIWLHAPIQENLLVRGLAWRPDEKIIAIGFIDMNYYYFNKSFY